MVEVAVAVVAAAVVVVLAPLAAAKNIGKKGSSFDFLLFAMDEFTVRLRLCEQDLPASDAKLSRYAFMTGATPGARGSFASSVPLMRVPVAIPNFLDGRLQQSC